MADQEIERLRTLLAHAYDYDNSLKGRFLRTILPRPTIRTKQRPTPKAPEFDGEILYDPHED